MAIQVALLTEEGVTTTYHRIVSMNVVTNHEIIIEVRSYIDAEGRAKEQESYDIVDRIPHYSKTVFIPTEYDENMDIKGAYDFIKTLPDYEGAIDV